MKELLSGKDVIAQVRAFIGCEGTGEHPHDLEVELVVSPDVIETEHTCYWFVMFEGPDRVGGTVFYVDRQDGMVYPASGSLPPRLRLDKIESTDEKVSDPGYGFHLMGER